MDKKNYFILFVVGILVFSCSSPQKTEPLFEQQKELTFNTLNVDELFFKPLCIEVFDSLLLVCDPTDEGIYTVLNLETKSIVCKGGSTGTGPNDLISSCIIDKIDNHRFQVIDVSNRKTLLFDIWDIVKTGKFIPYDNISFERISDNKENSIQLLYQINDSTCVGLGPINGAKYLLHGNKENKYIGEYPEQSATQVNPYWIHQGILHINREQKMFLYHSPFGYYCELMSFNNGQINPLFTDFKPHSYKVDNNECLITPETPCGINNAEIVKDGVFLLYSGQTMKDSPKMAFYCEKILFINLSGEHKIEYKLDRMASMMAIDEFKHKIYVISVNPQTYELELGYYKY